MFKLAIAIYSSLMRITPFFLRAGGFFSRKIADRADARKGIKSRWISGARRFDTDSVRVWFHVASVGEFLQAKPVISLLSGNSSPRIETALTFSSPSGINNLDKFLDSSESGLITFADYLPLDTPGNASFCLETLRPDIIVYVKYDLWPNLILEAENRGIPQILISAGLSESSGRYSFPARWFYGRLYSLLNIISASTSKDAGRFTDCSEEARVVTGGDTKYDQVYSRISKPDSSLSSPDIPSGPDYIVAGSTWPDDERLLLPGFSRLREENSNISLIIAPHEPTDERVEDIIRSADQLSLAAAPLSGIKGKGKYPVIIADGIGYLAELYRVGTIAYVGGGFSAGVHNVLEPAVLGLPVMFGPGIENSHEAQELKELGAGTVTADAAHFAETADQLLNNPDLLMSIGKSGIEYIESKMGASERYRDLIMELLE